MCVDLQKATQEDDPCFTPLMCCAFVVYLEKFYSVCMNMYCSFKAFLYCSLFSSHTAIYSLVNLYWFDKLTPFFTTDLFHIYGSGKMALTFTGFMAVP